MEGKKKTKREKKASIVKYHLLLQLQLQKMTKKQLQLQPGLTQCLKQLKLLYSHNVKTAVLKSGFGGKL